MYRLHSEALRHIATSAQFEHDRYIIAEESRVNKDQVVKALAGERAAKDELAAYIAVPGERKKLAVELETAISRVESVVSRFMPPGQLVATLKDLIVMKEVADRAKSIIDTALPPLQLLLYKVREERDAFRDKAIEQQYLAVEHVIVKAYQDGARDAQPRAFAAGTKAVFDNRPDVKLFTSDEYKTVAKAGLEALKTGGPVRQVHPETPSRDDTALCQAATQIRQQYSEAGRFLVAQAAHASLVASHCRCKKRQRELFDSSQRFLGGN